MKSIALSLSLVFLLVLSAAAQNPEAKFIADTLVVQAEGTYEADPDMATLTFDISSQDKELRKAYDNAGQSLQKIAALAEKNGLKKEETLAGVLRVTPLSTDRKGRAKAYLVQGRIVLKVRDFSKLGPILDEAVQDGITDFRSLTYSLADEEAAKQRAVGEAMKRAVGRATAALEQKGQKVGALRFASLDVKQLVGVARLEMYGALTESVEVSSGGGGLFGGRRKAVPVPPPPLPNPEKITVSATVQCAFQIQ
jgi:uncharacterized protein YggE